MVETGIRKVEKKESTLFSARHTYNANSIWPLHVGWISLSPKLFYMSIPMKGFPMS